MSQYQLSVAEIADKFDDCNFQLIFIESAMRSMIQTNNFSELHVGEGLSVTLLSIIHNYQDIQKAIDYHIQFQQRSATSTEQNDLVDIHDKDKKT